MAARVIATFSVVSAALCASLIACFDLFHSTRDILTACEIDAEAPGCGSDAGGNLPPSPPGDSGTDFCAWSPPTARDNARHACAWLGACETPTGGNAFGSCLFRALLAYDCQANPNHRVSGKTHDLWDCLWQVKSCADVDGCIFPEGPQSCGSTGNYSACGTTGDGGSSEVRIDCADGGTPPSIAHGENCALWGQTCASSGASSRCTGSGGLGCTMSGCSGAMRTELEWCVGGVDIGIDCASNGARRCDGFPVPDPDADLRWVACVAESDAGTTCAPDAAAACSGGVALSCPSGVPETIDCASLLGTDAEVCTAGPLAPPFDWTSPCLVTPSTCTTDSCTDAGNLMACVRGAPVALNCAAEQLGPCQLIRTQTGTKQMPACTPR